MTNTINGNGTAKTPTSATGTHTSYETDDYGNRVEVTYDATGKVIGSRKVGFNVGSKQSSGGMPLAGSQYTVGSQMNPSNWQRLLNLLRTKLGLSL